MRVTVSMIVGQIGSGRSVDEVLTEFPYLEREDIMQALRYAASKLAARSSRPAAGGPGPWIFPLPKEVFICS